MSLSGTGPHITLRTNLAEYPATAAIRDGRVTSPIVTLDCCGPKPASKGFKPMLRERAYDCGELAIVTFLQARCYGKPWVLLPVPVLGRLQHECAAYNGASGALSPEQIEGRDVGTRMYAQTTGLWVRGILQHEYGVDLDAVNWITTEDAHFIEYQDPPNCRRAPRGKPMSEMLLDGDIAAFVGNDVPKDERVRTLIPHAREAAQAWYAREGVIPINHMFAVHADIARERPDVVAEIYRMIGESRALAPPEAVRMLPPLGLEANRKCLALAIAWAFEQHIIPRRLSVDELFDDTAAPAGQRTITSA